MITTGLVAAAMALPWLSLLPLHGLVAVLAGAITLVAACHGAGLVVARLAGQRTAAPLLAIQWGTAALIGLSGVAIASHAGTRTTHAALVLAFTAVHTGGIALRFRAHADRVAESLAGWRSWGVPVVLLAVLGPLVVVGAAGDPFVRPFDDEGHVLAQLRRLLDTGALADPIGYPRHAQLGGQIALHAIAAGAGSELPRLVEPLAMVLALALTVSQIRAREASAALWATVLIASAFGLALAPTDPLPCWTAVGLLVALYATLGEAEPPALPLAVTAGALIALRLELLPIATVAVATAWWRRRADHRSTAFLVGGVLAVALPFVIARVAAWRAMPPIVQAALGAPRQAALVVRIALTLAIAAPLAGVLRLALPDRRAVRSAATASAVALGGLVAHLASTGAYGMRLAWPIALAFAAVVVIELARTPGTGPSALVTSLVLCLLLYEGREAPGRLRWSRRLDAAATGIEAVARPPGAASDRYTRLLARVPPGAAIAVWVSEPAQLDYTRHPIFDLRTPLGARLRVHRWDAHASKLAPMLAALRASYLLIERDDARVQRTQTDLLYRVVCQVPRAICADDLELLALRHPVIASEENLQLVALRP